MTNKNDVALVIIKRVKELQGCKGVVLASDYEVIQSLIAYKKSGHDVLDLADIFEELVDSSQIIEIEYELNDGLNRIKSFFLPIDTVVRSSDK